MSRTIRRKIAKRLALVRKQLNLNGGTVSIESGGIVVRGGIVRATRTWP